MNSSSLYLPLAVVVLIFGCGSEEITSVWNEQNFVIDGDGADWSSTGLHYVDDVRGVIGIANTDTSLSLMFRFLSSFHNLAHFRTRVRSNPSIATPMEPSWEKV